MGFEESIKEKLQKKLEEYVNAQLKIALIGQPGAGKSSLINKLLGKEIFVHSPGTDTTQVAEEAEFDNLIITDLPGYGTSMFPLEEWLEKFHPEEYDLYLFVFSGKLHAVDGQLFQLLKQWQTERKHPYFIVRNKLDDIWDEDKELDELLSEITADVHEKLGLSDSKVYFTSCVTGEGIEELKRDIIVSNLEDVKKAKFVQEFTASTMEDLAQKKQNCESFIKLYAAAAGANALNPIPGVDVGLDMKVVLAMTERIRKTYGLDDPMKWDQYIEQWGAVAKECLDKIINYASEKGLLIVLEQLGKRYALEKASKYIPWLGQTIACGAAYFMVYELGKSYADNCHQLAQLILEKKLAEESKQV